MDRKEQIKQAKRLIATGIGKDLVEVLKNQFPELRESKDERIRKSLINYVYCHGDAGDFTKKEFIAYLEKQKEHLPVPDKFSGLKSLMLQYLQSAANRKDDTEIESDTDLFGRKILDYVWKYSDEQKDIKVKYAYPKFRIGDIISYNKPEPGFINDYTIVGFNNEMTDYLVDGGNVPSCSIGIEFIDSNYHLKEQKPAWSEEDKTMLNNLIWAVHMKSISPLDEMDDRGKYERYEKFLTSLPERFGLKPEREWSEDERIRKCIRLCLDECVHSDIILDYERDECLAYLEKKKDASKAIEAVERIDKYIDEQVVNAHDMKDSNPDKKYYRGWDDALGEMSRILQDVYSDEKQKDQKLHLTVNGNGIYKICPHCKSRMIRDDSKVYTSIPPKYGYNCPKCGTMEFDTVIYDNPEMEEQKPAEWSEEDERNIDTLISVIWEHYAVCDLVRDDYPINAEGLVAWIQALKDRVQPQPKQEWSEKDEKMIKDIIDYMLPMPIFFETTTGQSGKEFTHEFIKKATTWLKFLKDRVQPYPNPH